MQGLKYVAAAATAALAVPSTAAQPTEAPKVGCPAFKSATAQGDQIHMTLSPAPDGPVYNWTVSAGTLFGNGAPTADLDIRGIAPGTPIVVEVEITDAGPACGEKLNLTTTVKTP